MSAHAPCQRCQFPNSLMNAYCAQCGAQMQPAAARGGGIPSWAKLFLIIAGTLLVAFLGIMAIAVVSPKSFAPRVATVTPQATSGGTAAAGDQVAATQQAKSTLPAINNAERLNIAKRFMNGGGRLDLDNAEGHLNNIQQSTPEYKEAQSLLKKIAARRAPLLREELAADYKEVVSNANTHLNYIDTKLTKVKGGFALWATHEYFSQFTLSIGNDAHVISAWIDSHRDDLKQAGIVRVGVMGKGGYASWSYFDIK